MDLDFVKTKFREMTVFIISFADIDNASFFDVKVIVDKKCNNELKTIFEKEITPLIVPIIYSKTIDYSDILNSVIEKLSELDLLSNKIIINSIHMLDVFSKMLGKGYRLKDGYIYSKD